VGGMSAFGLFLCFVAPALAGQARQRCAQTCFFEGVACQAGCLSMGIAAVPGAVTAPVAGPFIIAALVACKAGCSLKHVACLNGCSPLNCFADNTTVWMKASDGDGFQKVSIQDLKPGVELSTFVDGELHLTKVVSNKRVTATSDVFLQFGLAEKVGPLRVTENHNMLVLREGISKMIQASDVLVGDVMLGLRPQATHLSEEAGTLLANQCMVSSICDEPGYARYADASAALAAWKLDHTFRID